MAHIVVRATVAMAEVADGSLAASAAGGAGAPPPGGPGKDPIPPIDKVPGGAPETEEIPDEEEESEAPAEETEVRLRPCRKSLGGCGMENTYLRKYACINPRCVQASV